MIQYKATQNTIFGHTQMFMYYWWRGFGKSNTHRVRRIKVFIGLTIEGCFPPFFSVIQYPLSKLLYSFDVQKALFAYTKNSFFVLLSSSKKRQLTKQVTKSSKLRANDRINIFWIDEHESISTWHLSLSCTKLTWKWGEKQQKKLSWGKKIEQRSFDRINSAIRNKKYKWTLLSEKRWIFFHARLYFSFLFSRRIEDWIMLKLSI